ncbi:MAG: pentapeptide repeat-containing protein [Acidimicrobiales bacterium]|nr:pentapeptide repeat-containing protein [Acidimicrobiales bacterium]
MADPELEDQSAGLGRIGIARQSAVDRIIGWRAEHPGRVLDASGLILREANLSGVNLSGANFNGAWLESADLHDANLRGAMLAGAYLQRVDLRRADLREAVISGADMKGVNLQRADLRGARLERAHLGGADMCGANLETALQLHLARGLEYVISDADTVWPAGFDPADPYAAPHPEADDVRTGQLAEPEETTTYAFGVLPAPIAEAIAMALEPLEGEWRRGLSDGYEGAVIRRVESCFSAIRSEARSGQADALTVFRQLQMLAGALGTDDSSQWAELVVAFTGLRTPEAPDGASDAAAELDEAIGTLETGEEDQTLADIGRRAFAESYGQGLGKWAAGLTAGVVAAGVVGAAHVAVGADIAQTAVALGRWVLEVLKMSRGL